MKNFWFTDPFLKPLLPLAGACFVKGLGSNFMANKVFMGPNIFPVGPQIFPGAPPQIALKCPKKKAVIVTDDFSKRFIPQVQRSFQDEGFEMEVWDQAQPEAPLSTVKNLVELLDRFEPDLIIAVGGGSVIDTAKGGWVLYENPDADLYNISPLAPLVLRKKAIMAAVPTTAGTGSESTNVSVLHCDETHRKFYLAHPEILPDYALLAPQFTASMPPELTAGVGVDVLAHALDSFHSTQSSDYSDALAQKAVQMVFDWLPEACKNGDNSEARLRMIIASNMAGMAFSSHSTVLSHSLGQAFGGVFSFHHGLLVGLFLPYAVQFYQPVTDKTLEICKALDIPGESKEERVSGLIKKIKDLLDTIGIPWRIKDLDITEAEFNEKLDLLSQYALEDPPTFFSPRPLDHEQFKKIFQYAWDGKDIDF